MRSLFLSALATVALLSPAAAQTTTRQPDWARPLLVNDPDAIRVAGATLTPPPGGLAVRLTVAPAAGGVARVVRYQSDGKTATISMLRFTGHARNGWSLWGSETPVQKTVPAAAASQLDALARRALQQTAYGAEGSNALAACEDGALAFVEASDNTRTLSLERRCSWAGASGALAKALSDAAGSRDEEELLSDGIAEVVAVDTAFARVVAERGWEEASRSFAAEGAPVAPAPSKGALSRRPSGADVSARGDMAYSWGRWSATGGGETPASGDYLTVWRRDSDGAWKYVAHSGR